MLSMTESRCCLQEEAEKSWLLLCVCRSPSILLLALLFQTFLLMLFESAQAKFLISLRHHLLVQTTNSRHKGLKFKSSGMNITEEIKTEETEERSKVIIYLKIVMLIIKNTNPIYKVSPICASHFPYLISPKDCKKVVNQHLG